MNKKIFAIVVITVLMLGALELVARVYIGYRYGSSSAGIQERSLNLQYQPFVMWGDDLDEKAKDFLDKNRSAYKILLVGGSTAQGFNEKVLINTFSRILPGERVAVMNVAYGGYNIRQEVISTVLVSEKIRPNLILVLDGANDVIHSFRPNVKVGTTYVDKTYHLIMDKPYFAPIVHLLQKSQLFNGMLRLWAREYEVRGAVEKIDPAVDVYLNARSYLNKYALGAKIPIIFMLQPFVGFSDAIDDGPSKEMYKYREEYVMYGLKKIDATPIKEICYVNGNDLLIKKKFFLNFSDDVHFKDGDAYSYIANLFLQKFISCYQSR